MPSDSPPWSSPSAAVTSVHESPLLRQKAEVLARKMQLPLVEKKGSQAIDLLLRYTEDGLQLELGGSLSGVLRVDFLSDSLSYRRQKGGGIKQALARAVGIKPGVRPSILDATAGLGKDAFLLAALGCSVTMVERSPLLAALLEDGLQRASQEEELQGIVDRLSLIQGDSTEIITKHRPPAETIYLDPMYPHSKKSALNRQEMRIIRKLVGDDQDAAGLLETALGHAKRRVVVKRPKGAPLLTDKSPSHVIKMKNSRYDVYMLSTSPGC
ncbi:MAG: class I SAM-dependent methyltransferase [Thermodesulfobacteriota bacterium]